LLRMLLLLLVGLSLLLVLLFLLLILLTLGLLLRMLLLLLVGLSLLLVLLFLLLILLTLGLLLLLGLRLLFLFLGFLLGVLACVSRNNQTQKQKHCCCTENSNWSHSVTSITPYSCARHRAYLARFFLPIVNSGSRIAALG
jgi:hypothetical protein